MGKGCNGDCNSCKPPSIPAKGRYVTPELPIRTFLDPPSSPYKNRTPLSGKCNCSTHKVKRYTCLPCIRSWVQAVCKCEVLKAIDEYKDNLITVDRLRMCLEERRREARLDANGNIAYGCGDCYLSPPSKE